MQAELESRLRQEIAAAQTKDEVLRLKGQWLGRQGEIQNLMQGIREILPEKRKEFGQQVNHLKNLAEELISARLNEMDSAPQAIRAEDDPTLPGIQHNQGNLHPLTLITRRICQFFEKRGFAVESGPEIETQFYNFEALNVPEYHPARDEQDTFWLPDGRVLRTQTSGIQIRTMEKRKPPLRIIAPGKVFRCDHDATHSPVFHQIEGLMVDEHIHFGHLKQILKELMQELFGKDREVRFRPSFFPFTEPSAEMDVSCYVCNGSGCRLCKQTGWIEILGCGMVDPNVFLAVGLDSEVYTGWAFGIGVERIAMNLYGVPDIRLFFENDIRFLKQFRSINPTTGR